jgi:hypothetical protein
MTPAASTPACPAAQLSNRTVRLIGAAALVRFAAFVATLSVAGPLLGMGTGALVAATRSRVPAAVEYSASAVLIVAGVLVAIAAAGGSPRSLAAVRVTGWFIIADTVVYLTSVAVGIPVLACLGQVRLLSPVVLLTGPDLAANAALLVLAVKVVHAADVLRRGAGR